MSKRAYRRHHRARMLARAKRLLRIQGWSSMSGVTEEDIEKWARHLAENFTVCSCVLCGNPRRIGRDVRLTVQERRAFQDPKEEEFPE